MHAILQGMPMQPGKTRLAPVSTTVTVLVPRALLLAESTFVTGLAPDLIHVDSWDSANPEDDLMLALRLVRPVREGAIVSVSGPTRAGELVVFLGDALGECLGGAVVSESDSVDDAVKSLRDRPAPASEGVGAWFLAFANGWVENESDADEHEVEVPWAREWLSRTAGTVPESLLEPQPVSAVADRVLQHYVTIDDEGEGVAVTAEEATQIEAVQEAMFEAAQSGDDDDEVGDAVFLAALGKAGVSAAVLTRIEALFESDDAGGWTELTIAER